MKQTEDYYCLKQTHSSQKKKGAQASILHAIQEKRIGTNYDSLLSAWR